ncbi:MAG: hypothetical protein PHR26_02215 [Candidatus ainarchaeum sp.]|nr:hypothetical protein [Candidatus ainarchaeum sp.]MDD3976203.1 hypothetical protein [Candidatus ainarchaeum sp.]
MFNKLKEKGQAFSTFQLLIAAVVALAILGVLLPMITKNINIGGDVTDSINTTLKTQVSNYGNLAYTDEVKVSSKNTEFVSTSSIVAGTGIDSNQVYFDIAGNDNFFAIGSSDTYTTGKTLKMKSSENTKFKFGILCADSSNSLIKIINDYDLVELDTYEEFGETDATVCVIFPKKI